MNNQKGITLIEVLAGTVILTLVVVMFLNLSSFSLVSNRNDDLRINALRLAEQELNEYRNILKSPVPILNSSNDSLNWPNQEVTTNPPYRIYVQQTSLDSNVYDMTRFVPGNYVSLQSVILFEDRSSTNFKLIPRKFTVTVYWEGS